VATVIKKAIEAMPVRGPTSHTIMPKTIPFFNPSPGIPLKSQPKAVANIIAATSENRFAQSIVVPLIMVS